MAPPSSAASASVGFYDTTIAPLRDLSERRSQQTSSSLASSPAFGEQSLLQLQIGASLAPGSHPPRRRYRPRSTFCTILGGDQAEAEIELDAVLEELGTYPTPLVAWRTYALLGRLGEQMGDRPSAREAYKQAADIVHTMASKVTDENPRATFLGSSAVKVVLDESAFQEI